MSMPRSIFIGVLVYLAMYFGEKGIYFAYFYITYDFATSNLLMIKSSFMIALAALLGGYIAGYLSQRGFLTGFIVGTIAGMSVLLTQQFTGANPLLQEYTPAILFDEVFLKACICSVAGAAGELVSLQKTAIR